MHILMALAVALFAFLSVFARDASAMEFRRPIDRVLDPAISAHYDNDPSAGAKMYSCGSGSVYNGHRGTDFRAVVGTDVRAGAAGYLYSRVTYCPTYGFRGSTCGGGFGNHVRIDHEGPADGYGWVTIYAHLQKYTAAPYGPVACGDTVGSSGSSGNSTGPHVHFEVRKYSGLNNDPFPGRCSGPYSFWTGIENGVPSASCT